MAEWRNACAEIGDGLCHLRPELHFSQLCEPRNASTMIECCLVFFWFIYVAMSDRVQASAIGAGTAGTFTQQAGFLAYYEIKQLLASGGVSAFDSASRSMFAWKGNQWVGYDDVSFIALKVDYAISRNLAGGMVWAIDLDDFPSSSPLIRALAQVCPSVTLGVLSSSL